MGYPVDFNDQARAEAAEIDHISVTDGMLLAEFEAAWTLAQMLPQDPLGQ